MRIAIVNFPGSHGADDVLYAYSDVLGQSEVYQVWHLEENLQKPDLVIIPGGATYGDYLRPGALAKSSPICGPVRKFAMDGGPVLGIGNGFQILCEIEVLPGILLLNQCGRFLNEDIFMMAEPEIKSPFAKHIEPETILQLPLACSAARYHADKRTLQDIEDNGQVVFRFCDRFGELDEGEQSKIGSTNCIAALANRHHNVLGLMPHPERAIEKVMGSEVGLELLKPILG